MGINIENEYQHCIRSWGAKSLPPLTDIPIEVSTKSVREFGHARWARKVAGGPVEYSIRISTTWFLALRNLAGVEAAKAELQQTIIHELAHISTFYTNPGFEHLQGHDAPFYQLMRKAGYNLVNRFHFNNPAERVGSTNVTWGQVCDAVKKGK